MMMIHVTKSPNKSRMTSVLYSVSSIIGKALSVKDRISMTLAHPSFKAAHEEFDYQTWDVAQWTASDRENVNIWSEKMRALVKRKPRISDINIHAKDGSPP